MSNRQVKPRIYCVLADTVKDLSWSPQRPSLARPCTKCHTGCSRWPCVLSVLSKPIHCMLCNFQRLGHGAQQTWRPGTRSLLRSLFPQSATNGHGRAHKCMRLLFPPFHAGVVVLASCCWDWNIWHTFISTPEWLVELKRGESATHTHIYIYIASLPCQQGAPVSRLLTYKSLPCNLYLY